MSIEHITLVVFGALVLFLVLGLPVVFALSGVAIISAFLLWGPQAGRFVYVLGAWDIMKSFLLVAVPLFIFMGLVLEKAGIADDLYEMIYRWMGAIRGGLAVGTVAICTAFAAMVGISGAATVSMGVIALPSMLKRGYSKHIATGCIQAGGALGFLIPPSVTMIVYALMSRASVGRLFAGGVIPGLILATLFIIYILIRCFFQPKIGPSVPREERFSWKQKFTSLKAVILPIALIMLVLGAIFGGFATPTEASAIGAFGSLVCAAIYRRLNWKMFKETAYRTLSLTSMVIWIAVGATAFSAVYQGLGASELISNWLTGMNLSPWTTLVIMQLSFFVMGCFMDDWCILFITLPIYLPIITNLGFDIVWYGVLFIVNMEMAFLTPPFGYNLFYMKAVVPPGITMADLYRSIVPFVALQAVGLVLVMYFPQLVLWLPNLLFGK